MQIIRNSGIACTSLAKVASLIGILTLVMPGMASAGPGLEMDAMFAAYNECPALPILDQKHNNPGNIRLEMGLIYKVVASNTYSATHYRIVVEGANPKYRWVPVNCGTLANVGYEDNIYLLSLSWHAGYCKANPGKSECDYLNAERYDATNLTLTGLWPQPHSNIYCDVKDHYVKLSNTGDWINLPQLELSKELRGTIATYMPRVASSLQRHQWIKHGTCYGQDSDTYYKDSIHLLKQINEDGLAELLYGYAGTKIDLEDIDLYMTDKYGAAAAGKVAMRCKDGDVTELWLSLKGEIGERTLRQLLNESKPVQRSCTEGMVAGIKADAEGNEKAGEAVKTAAKPMPTPSLKDGG